MKLDELLQIASTSDPDSLKELSRELTRSGYSTDKSLFIPEIGTELLLTSDWDFPLYMEFRNIKNCYRLFGIKTEDMPYDSSKSFNVSIKAGSILKVDRIYIKKGLSSFSSITFNVTYPDKKTKGRFWAKLKDVNKIVCEIFKPELDKKFVATNKVKFNKFLSDLYKTDLPFIVSESINNFFDCGARNKTYTLPEIQISDVMDKVTILWNNDVASYNIVVDEKIAETTFTNKSENKTQIIKYDLTDRNTRYRFSADSSYLEFFKAEK